MNYKKIYNNIIETAKNRVIDGYAEKHHIVPRSLGGTNDKDNLVLLTAREHFICHYLLAKMYDKESFEWYKMNHAFLFMKSNSMYQSRYINSKLYESLRINFARIMSHSQKGKNNSQYGTKWIKHPNLHKEKKIAKKEAIPLGWELGGLANDSYNTASKKKPKAKKVKVCKSCGQEHCIRPAICRNGQRIKRFVESFGFDRNVIGTAEFYIEYDRIVEQLTIDYQSNMMSVEEMKVKYNISLNETMRQILKSLNIERRDLSTAVRNIQKGA